MGEENAMWLSNEFLSISSIAFGFVGMGVASFRSRTWLSGQKANPANIVAFLIIRFFAASMAPSGLLLMVASVWPNLLANIPMAGQFIFFAGFVVVAIAVLATVTNRTDDEI